MIPSDSIALVLNGTVVSAEITQVSTGVYQVSFNPGLLEPGSVHTVELRYVDPSSSEPASSQDWSFTMAPYNLPPLDLSKGSLLYFPFEEPTAMNGDALTDLSPSQNNGILRLDDSGVDKKIDGAVGKAIDFNIELNSGALNFVELSKPYGASPNSFMCWLKVDPEFPEGTRVGIMLGSFPTENNVNWEVHTSGLARIWWNNGQVDWRVTGADMRTGNWEHIAFVRDVTKGSIFFYRNGKLAASINQVCIEVNGTALPYIGADLRGAATHVFKGQLDEVAVFNSVLTPEQVFQAYAAAFDFPTFQFPSPKVLLVEPGNESKDVNVAGAVQVTIDEAGSVSQIRRDSLTLTLNGQAVVPTLADDNGRVIVRHAPDAGLMPGTQYTARIEYSDTNDNQTSEEWTFTTAAAPKIVSEPSSAVIVAGFPVSFSVQVESVLPVFYQWRFNGTNLDNATGATLTIDEVGTDNAGVYDCVITANGGKVTTSPATLEVVPLGVLEVVPADGATFVLPNSPIRVVLVDSQNQIPVASMKLFINGREVTIDVDSSEAGRHIATHSPIPLEPGAIQELSFQFEDPSNPGQPRSFEWSFTMAPYNLPPLDLAAESILYFAFDESTAQDGETILDQSQFQNNGTLFVPEGGDRKVPGIRGGAIDFFPYADGGVFDAAEYNRVEVAERFAAVPNSFSVWIKVPEDFPADRVGNILAGCCEDPDAINWEIHASGRPRIWWDNGAVNWIHNPDDLRTGQWEHIAFVRDSSKNLFSYYRNGQLVATFTASSADVIPTLPPIVGADYRAPARQVLKGQIDELAVFNKVLTADEVFRVFAASLDFPDYQFPSPPIISISPVDGDFNIALAPTISAQIDENNSLATLVPSTISLKVNDVVVTPTISKQGTITTVSYTSPSPMNPGQNIQVELSYGDSNNGQTIRSWNFTLVPLPVINRHPVTASVAAGSALTLSVSVTSPSPITYQWRHKGEIIPDAIGASLTLVNVQPVDSGLYDVVVTGPGGTVTSNAALISVASEILPRAPEQSLQFGLMAAWPFDGSFQSHIPGFDAEPINGASLVDTAKIGSGAASFVQAQSQYADVNRQVIMDGSFAYSVSGWINVSGGSGRRFLWETSDSNWAISAEVTPDGNIKAFIRLDGGSSHSADSGIQAQPGQWYHVLVTFDGVLGMANLFVNGQKIAVEFTPELPPVTGTASTIGFHMGSFRGGSDRFFDGLMDDVGVWNRVLRDAEIQYLASGQAIPVPDASLSLPRGLVANWHFDTGFASFSSEWDGTAVNGASIVTDSKVGAGSADFSQASGQYVNVDSQVIADNALAYSSAGWFKVRGGSGRRFLWETSDSNWAISSEITPAGTVKVFIRLADNSSHSLETGFVAPMGAWHHLAVRFDGVAGMAEVFVDGQRSEANWDVPFPPGVGTAPTTGFHMGSFRGGSDRFFDGQLDEVGIWSRPLTDLEIAFLAGGNPIPDPDAAFTLLSGQRAAWNFDGDFTGSAPQFLGQPVNGASLSDDAKAGTGSAVFNQSQGQYVDVTSPVLNDGALAYTSSGWFKVTGGTGRRFLWETADSNWAISTEITPAGNLKAFIRQSDSSSHSIDTLIQPPLDEWHHVAVTFDGVRSTFAVYYDGELVNQPIDVPLVAGLGTAPTTGFHIGSFRGGSDRFFQGHIDEVGIWDRVLRQFEIGFLAQGNSVPTPDSDPIQHPPTIAIDSISVSNGTIRIQWSGGNPPYQILFKASLSSPWQALGDPTSESFFETPLTGDSGFFLISNP